MTLSPGAYLGLRRRAAALSIQDMAARVAAEPHVDAIARAEWLRRIEADLAPIGDDVLTALLPLRDIGFRFDPLVLVRLSDIHRGEQLLAPQICAGCGCTDFVACLDAVAGAGCHWISDDRCSVCGPAQASSEVL